MPNMTEKKLFQKMKHGTRHTSAHWTRMEFCAIPGIPDVHCTYQGVSFWVELKCAYKWRPHQKSFQFRNAKSGGIVWNMIHVHSKVKGDRLIFVRGGDLLAAIEESIWDRHPARDVPNTDAEWESVLSYFIGIKGV